MADTIEFGVEVVGTTEAANAIDSIKAKQQQAANVATQAAHAQKQADREVGDQHQRLAQQTASVGSAVGVAAQAVGRFNSTAGQLTQSLAATVTQMPQLITQLGALGAVVGAANLAFSAFSIYEQRQQAALEQRRADVARLARTFDDLVGSIEGAQRAQDRFDRVQHEGGSQAENQALGQRYAAIATLLRQAGRGDRTALDEITSRGIPELGLRPGNRQTQFAAELAGQRDAGLLTSGLATPEGAAARIIDPLMRTLADRIREFRGSREAQGNRQYAESLAGAGAITGGPDRPARGGGGPSGEDNSDAAWDRYNAAVASGLARERALWAASSAELLEKQRGLHDEEVERKRATEEQIRAIEEQSAENRRALLERDRELVRARDDVMRGFYESERAGLASVLDAATATNRALTDLHLQTLDSGRVWASGMAAIGNEVATSIGSNLQSAFSSSLGAFLDGSKSFGEAALDMVRGVTRALTQEGIVQAIVETARGLAALATTWGTPNPAALLHFASAGVWAAVAGGAGLVGAATGAFGGGGRAASAGAGGGARPAMAQPQQNPSNVTVNILTPNAVLTEAERGQMVAQSIREARRQFGASGVRV